MEDNQQFHDENWENLFSENQQPFNNDIQTL